MKFLKKCRPLIIVFSSSSFPFSRSNWFADKINVSRLFISQQHTPYITQPTPSTILFAADSPEIVPLRPPSGLIFIYTYRLQ